MKLVFVTQEVDPEHAALAQTVDLVAALASRVDELAVVARRIEVALPANASGRSFDARSRLGRTIAFERAVASALPGADAVLAHMVPEFALLAAPLTRVRRVPLFLWYTHWNASRALRLATGVVDAALSVDARSFPIATAKLRAIGHAIDVERFDAAPVAPHAGPLRVLAFGRTARWKGLGTLLDAVALVDAVDLRICGPSLTSDEVAHRAELIARAEADPAVRGRARLLEPVTRDEVPGLIASADVVASPNEPRAGATLDKAVFEAAACRRPVVSTNAAFGQLLGGLPIDLLAPPRDSRALADRLDALVRARREDRLALGEELRRRVVAGHSLDHWARAVLDVVAEVRSARGTAGSRRAG
ncbi:MAG: glycosyltransferase family 4 protein [Gaiellaceae bacterium]